MFILPNNPHEWTTVEVEGCRIDGNSEEERTVIVVDNDKPEFWSVYLGNPQGELSCYGDFNTSEDATDFASELHEAYGFEIVPGRIGGRLWR